jgi:Ca2+-binding RTX toxin-like protein
VSSVDGKGRSFEFCPTNFETEAEGCQNGLLIQATEAGAITGSDCSDVIIGPDADLIAEIMGNDGDDVLVVKSDKGFGGNGNDWIYITNTNAKAFGDAGQDHLYGTSGDDFNNLTGGADTDYLYGLDGNDRIYAQGGDFVYGGDGNDWLTSTQLGGNTLFGGPGDNSFRIEETESDVDGRTTIKDFQFYSGNEILFKKDGAYNADCVIILSYEEVRNAGCLSNTLYAEFFDNTMTILA